MAVTLYTSRVVLETLGVEDFGIYNIVGGVVVLFTFLNTAMATTTQRFLSFEIGKEQIDTVKRIFSTSMTIHIGIAILVLILAESIGLWFLLTKMNIPDGRMTAAIYCYQFSILTTCIQIIRVPYHACMIAYEKMSLFAYISILEIILRLAIVYLLLLCNNTDRLILYSLLTFIIALIIIYIYKKACNKKFDISHYCFIWDKTLLRKMLSFSGWSLLGNAANMGVQHGSNILLNLFHGVVINSAVGISNQITHALYSFVSNFQIAFNPALVKSYATNDLENLRTLIFKSSKFSFFLLFFFSMPLFLYSDFFLKLWLKEVPVYTNVFCELTLLFLSLDALSAPLWITVQASGKIKWYQVIVSNLIFLNLPISYILLKQGLSPVSVFQVRLFLSLIIFIFRLVYVKKIILFSCIHYMYKVLFPIILVILLSIPLAWWLKTAEISIVIAVFSILIQTSILIYFVGFTISERKFIIDTVKNKFRLSKDTDEQ